MSKNTLTPIKVLSFLLFISILFSCSKDTDLFAENILLDEIVNIEDSENNPESQEIIETTIDLENAVISTNEDVAVLFNMLNNITGKSKRNFKSFKQPKNGSLSLQKDSLALYSPSSDFNGTDELEITLEVTNEDDTISDLVVLVDATVIAVADVRNDTVTTTENTAVLIEPFNNDTFTGGNVIISEVTTPSHGSAILNGNYVINYAPETNYIGEDIFYYTTEFTNTDGSKSMEQGTVTVTINPVNDPTGSSANLLFKSGFEGNIVLGERIGNYKYFAGVDSETGFTFPASLGGSYERVQHIGSGSITNSRIETVIGHGGGNTRAFYREVSVANGQETVYQAPHQLTEMTATDQKFYVKMWMKVDASSFTGTNKYRAIWEYKTYNYASYGTGFRVAAYMNMDSSGNEQWVLKGDDGPGSNGTVYWNSSRRDIPFPKDEWFKLEYFVDFVADGSATGRVWMKINDEIIADMTNVKTARQSGDPIRTLFLSTVYGANGPLYAWVDDLEIWDDVPY